MTRYEQGFMNKCAEYGVDGRELVAHLEKRSGTMARLVTKLSPKVNPDKLNWFTRLFTKTRNMPTRIRTVGRDLGPSLGDAFSYGAEAGSPETFARGMRSVTRLSPGRILAALGITGGAGALAHGLASDGAGSASPASSGGSGGSAPKIDKKVLSILAGLGGAGAAAGAGIAVSRKKKKKDDKDGKDGKDKK